MSTALPAASRTLADPLAEASVTGSSKLTSIRAGAVPTCVPFDGVVATT